MVKILDDIKNAANNFLNTGNDIQDPNKDGFPLSSNIPADGNGLPSTKYREKYSGKLRRNIIKWFIPEFGIVSMYVNPQSISYSYNKLITKERTKSGYSLQYWGEELTTLNISGVTGSSGIEGINVLYEIYRAEQFAIDGAALKVEAANNNANNLATQAIEGAFSGLGGLIGGSLGSKIGSEAADFLTSSGPILPMTNPSLAQYAFSVEMYYGGSVFRGYFNSFTINERADNFNFDYSIQFTVTQQRGYRTNYFPFHKNPYYSPTQYDQQNNGEHLSNSYKRTVKG